MKVACPHCNVAYSIDDRRVPATGLNVRCPKCRNTFPVRKEAPPAAAAEPAPVPLPAPAAAPAQVVAPPPPPASPFGAAVPLPAPAAIAPPPPPAPDLAAPEDAAFAPPGGPFAAPPAADGPVPLPAPGGFAEPAFAEPAFAEPAFAEPDAPAPPPPAEEEAPAAEPGPDPFAFSPAEFAAPAPPLPVDPFPVEPPPAAAPPLPDMPLPDLAASEPPPAPPPAGDLGFGEIDFASPPVPPADLPPLPTPATHPAPPPAAAPGPQEELEMLFGAEGAEAPAAKKQGAPAGADYKVRRRSGKVFGPFDQGQIVEMLGKGELMGNEDVSPDGGESWTPIAAVPAFGDALRAVSAEPLDGVAGAGGGAGVPFGDRMAAAKVVEGKGRPAEEEEEPGATPRWRKLLVPAAIVLVLAGVGVGAGFTKMGFFFLRAFRRGDQGRVTALLAEARTALQRAEYPGDRAALDAANRALATDPDALDAAALHAGAVAILELRHGAPAGALDQARRNADRLDAEEKGSIAALAARLAVALATAPGAGTLPQETALEAVAAKSAPDADVLALLARAALARGDGARAAALYAKLDALKPGTPRGTFGTGLALAARRDPKAARAAFEKVLQATPGHLPSRLELAALSEAAGEPAEAEAHLAPLFADGADQRLAPGERARALALRGALLSRVAQRAGEADQAFDEAVKADGRLVEVRLAFAAHRLRRGDAPGAIAVLEPVAAQAASLPALAALRIRALAAAGRALDAASLADQALAKSPGDPGLLLAKAAALEAAGKRPEAAALFADAAARDPAAVEPRLALGRIALAAGDLAKARAELVAAAEKGPREAAPRALLGELAAAEGDTAAAQRAYQEALELDPEYALAEIGLAKLAIAKGDDAAARARLEKALGVDPRSVEGHVQYGTLLWRAKELPGAAKALQAAVDLRPTHAVALTRLGAVQYERGEVDAAVGRLTAAVGEDEKLPEARLWLGRALLKKGETPGAVAALQKAVALQPGNPENHVALGLALERAGALTEALDAYRAASAADPRFAEAYERLGAIYANNGRFDEAAAAYEKAVQVAPSQVRNRIALGDARAKLGKHEQAIKIFREAMRQDPRAVQVVYKLARSVHEAEGARAALPLYERAAKEERDNPMPHYFLGYLYKDRAQKARAISEFKRFLELKPDADEKKDIEAEIEDLAAAR